MQARTVVSAFSWIRRLVASFMQLYLGISVKNPPSVIYNGPLPTSVYSSENMIKTLKDGLECCYRCDWYIRTHKVGRLLLKATVEDAVVVSTCIA